MEAISSQFLYLAGIVEADNKLEKGIKIHIQLNKRFKKIAKDDILPIGKHQTVSEAQPQSPVYTTCSIFKEKCRDFLFSEIQISWMHCRF